MAQVLRPLSERSDPNIIVGLQTSDDAAVYRVQDGLAIVQTVDFFPPVVDDPYTYGAIAAANSMSDVFAMGGKPMFALNVAAYPADLPLDILSRIFEGGADKAAEAGIVIAGGHTVTDNEPKYGLIVTGSIDPDHIMTKGGTTPGDLLFITKALGTGVITTSIKQGAASQEHADAAIQSMSTLNLAASRMLVAAGVTGCTDITGFGLVGHGTEMSIASGTRLEFDSTSIPLLPGALKYAKDGRSPGGLDRNREFYADHPEAGVTIDSDVDPALVDLLFNPETSGGLLFSASEDQAAELQRAFEEAGHPLWQIGRVASGRGITVR